MTTSKTAIRQRADLTYKHNVSHGRHGWLRLTPAYSVRVVEQVLAEFGDEAERVFEPFSGTGTTALCAAYRGLRAIATDINPFLVWVGRTKNARYTEAVRLELESKARRIAARLEKQTRTTGAPPRLKNIERWWNASELAFLIRLRGEIGKHGSGPATDLLKMAFCRTLIALSNAAYNHQSLSFKQGRGDEPSRRFVDTRGLVDQFLSDVRTIRDGAADNPPGEARIERLDARELAGVGIDDGAFDLLVTSPPYPNRMSYIRELRPYMYWLGFLDGARDAGELDWEAIGGTWGIATSRLLTWKPTGAFVPGYLLSILENIRSGHPKNGELMANYIHKYFDDMFVHFRAASKLVRRGGSAHYVIGNSTFYGQVVPAERIYADQLVEAGFRRAEVRVLRKRNSKKELFEFHVVAER